MARDYDFANLWLWQHWLGRGLLTVIDGLPAAGKTTFAADLAALIARRQTAARGAGTARERRNDARGGGCPRNAARRR